jgi:hypothetical protein
MHLSLGCYGGWLLLQSSSLLLQVLLCEVVLCIIVFRSATMANQYARNHPLLPPLASGMKDNSLAAGIVAGAPLNDQDIVDATRQHKSRKHLRDGNNNQTATDAEVRVAKKQKHIIIAKNIAPEGIANLTNLITGLSSTINDQVTGLAALSNTVNDPVTGLATLSNNGNDPVLCLAALLHPLATEQSCNINRSFVRTGTDAPVPLPNNAGAQPPAWFATISVQGLEESTMATLDQISNFYQIPVNGTIFQTITAIKMYLGITF